MGRLVLWAHCLDRGTRGRRLLGVSFVFIKEVKREKDGVITNQLLLLVVVLLNSTQRIIAPLE